MSDLSPEFDFTAAANAAIEAAEAPAEAEQPRDDQGRFASPEPDPEPDPQPDPEPEPDAAPDPENISPDLNSELEQLRKRLADKDAFIDRQGNELGELRKAFEERFDTLQAQVNKPAPQQITEDLIDRDPAAATRLAYEQGNQAALGAAFQAWKDDDPAAAGAWAAYTASQQEMAAREQEIRQAYEQRLNELEQRIAPLSQASVDQQRAEQVRALTTEIPADQLSVFLESPDFGRLAEEHGMEADLADPARQVSAIKTLFYVHRGRAADTLSRTVQDVARETAEQAAQAASDAYVASASTATATTAAPMSEQERIAAEMAARITHRNSVWNDGWERS